jgi:hypothetical protein
MYEEEGAGHERRFRKQPYGTHIQDNPTLEREEHQFDDDEGRNLDDGKHDWFEVDQLQRRQTFTISNCWRTAFRTAFPALLKLPTVKRLR